MKYQKTNMKYFLILHLILTFAVITYGFLVATHKTITEKAYYLVAAKSLGLHTDVEYNTPLSLFEAAFGSTGAHMNGTSLTSKPTTKYFEAYLSDTIDRKYEVESSGDERYTWNANTLSNSYNLLKTLQNNMRTSITNAKYDDLRKLCTQMYVLTQNFYARTNYIELGNSGVAEYLVQTSGASLPSNIKSLGIDKEDQFNAYHRQATLLALNTTVN